MCRFVINSTPSMDAQRLAKCCANRECFQSEKANKFILIVEPLDYTTLVSPPGALFTTAPTTIHACLLVFPIVLSAFAQFFSVSTIKQPKHTSHIYLIYVLWKLIWWMASVSGGKGAVGGLINQTFTTEGMMTDNRNVMKWNSLDVVYCVFHFSLESTLFGRNWRYGW